MNYYERLNTSDVLLLFCFLIRCGPSNIDDIFCLLKFSTGMNQLPITIYTQQTKIITRLNCI